MNIIQNLIDRQLGIYSRFSYDSTLRRLVVDSEESFYGLQSSNVVASFDQDPPIFACRFSEAPGYEHILALANEDGRVAIQNTESKASASILDGIQCHDNAVFDLAWMPQHMSFVTVSGDHTACLWDVGEGSPRKVMMFCSHTRSVKTAAFRPNEPHVFASGGRDGAVLVWDTRSPGPAGRLQGAAPRLQLRPEACLAGCHAAPRAGPPRPRPQPPRAASVTGLVFQDDLTLISCGECDGNIKVWDLRRGYSAHRREPLPKHAIPYCGGSARNGYTNLLVDAARVRLYASCMDNVIYCFNVATYNTLPERRYRGHENGTFYIKTSLSPDSAYLVSGSSDKNAYVWNVRSSEPVARLTGHWAEVTCAAWCQRGDPKVVTCSDDARHKVWRVGPEWRGRAGPEWQGRAEPVPRLEGAPRPRWGTLDKTPSSLKRKSATPSSGGAKRCRPSGPSTERRTKRCLTDMMNAARGADEREEPAKRLRLDVPEEEGTTPPRAVTPDPSPSKRATSPNPSPSKRATSPNPSPSKRARHDSPPPDWGYVPVAGSSFMTPTKNYENRTCKIISPTLKDNPPSEAKRECPTGELPDFVLTGEAPHQRLMSPVKQKQDTTDWLTLMVRERRTKGPKVPDCDKPAVAPLSPRDNLPARRNSVTDKTPKAKKTRTLLKYFSVATKGK